MPLSLAMDDGGFDRGGGSGSSGGPVAVAVRAVDYRDRWQWRLIMAAALGGGHATTSRRSERVAQQKNKRVAQGEAMQQPANLLPRRCFDMRHCHLSCRHRPSILVCHAAMAICGIVFGRAVTAMVRNRAMATAMAVALEEEGNGDGDKEGNGKQ